MSGDAAADILPAIEVLTNSEMFGDAAPTPDLVQDLATYLLVTALATAGYLLAKPMHFWNRKPSKKDTMFSEKSSLSSRSEVMQRVSKARGSHWRQEAIALARLLSVMVTSSYAAATSCCRSRRRVSDDTQADTASAEHTDADVSKTDTKQMQKTKPGQAKPTRMKKQVREMGKITETKISAPMISKDSIRQPLTKEQTRAMPSSTRSQSSQQLLSTEACKTTPCTQTKSTSKAKGTAELPTALSRVAQTKTAEPKRDVSRLKCPEPLQLMGCAVGCTPSLSSSSGVRSTKPKAGRQAEHIEESMEHGEAKVETTLNAEAKESQTGGTTAASNADQTDPHAGAGKDSDRVDVNREPSKREASVKTHSGHQASSSCEKLAAVVRKETDSPRPQASTRANEQHTVAARPTSERAKLKSDANASLSLFADQPLVQSASGSSSLFTDGPSSRKLSLFADEPSVVLVSDLHLCENRSEEFCKEIQTESNRHWEVYPTHLAGYTASAEYCTADFYTEVDTGTAWLHNDWGMAPADHMFHQDECYANQCKNFVGFTYREDMQNSYDFSQTLCTQSEWPYNDEFKQCDMEGNWSSMQIQSDWPKAHDTLTSAEDCGRDATTEADASSEDDEVLPEVVLGEKENEYVGLQLIAELGEWCVLKVESDETGGRPFFWNSCSGEKTWTMPPIMKEMGLGDMLAKYAEKLKPPSHGLPDHERKIRATRLTAGLEVRRREEVLRLQAEHFAKRLPSEQGHDAEETGLRRMPPGFEPENVRRGQALRKDISMRPRQNRRRMEPEKRVEAPKFEYTEEAFPALG